MPCEEAGCLYSYANYVVMPDGYSLFSLSASEKTMDTLYAKQMEKLRTIAEDIRTEQFRLILKFPFTPCITHIMPVSILPVKISHSNSLSWQCISCTLCYRIVHPQHTMQEGKPVFSNNHRIFWLLPSCPVQAITLQKKS